MKKNSLIIFLLIIIFILSGYIIYNQLGETKQRENNDLEEKITLIDIISLDYVDIYLTSDGNSYIIPLNKEEIKSLDGGANLKERLNTLYERAFYFDIYINNNKLKGFKVILDDDITKIRKLEIDGNSYVIFIKGNNKIGVFNYAEYYNLLYTKVEDNYNNLENVKDIEDNKIIYLNGRSEEFKLKK